MNPGRIVNKTSLKRRRKEEDILNRIFDLAESESVRGTHPELEESLRTVDATIGTLIKQINGVVAGQDTRIEDLKEKLNQAIEEKQAALEQAKEREDAAKEFEAEIRKADAENVRLQMELEQLKKQNEQ